MPSADPRSARFTKAYGADREKVFTIKGISHRPAKDESFTVASTGQSQTIPQFYKQQYNVTLRFPGWPCIRGALDVTFPSHCLAI